MNGKEYLMTQMTLVELGKKASTLKLDEFLKCISNAEMTVPMLDPTLFVRAERNLRAIKKLAVAFKVVQINFAETQDAVIGVTMAYLAKGRELPTAPVIDEGCPCENFDDLDRCRDCGMRRE